MAGLLKRHRHIQIPVVFRGVTVHVKEVTKSTTCGDVIEKLLRDSGAPESPLEMAMFESANGIETVLPVKTKIQKHLRAWGSSSNFHLVLRKADSVMSVPKISKAKRRLLRERCKERTPGVGCSPGECKKDKERFRNLQRLTDLMDIQREKLQEATGFENKKNFVSVSSKKQKADIGDCIKKIYFDDDEEDENLVEFMSNVDSANMNGLLEFCAAVTTKEINRLSYKKTPGTSKTHGFVKKDNDNEVDLTIAEFQQNSSNVKFAVKKALTQQPVAKVIEQTDISDSYYDECGPMHSTPNAMHTRASTLKRMDKMPKCALKSKLSRLDKVHGKRDLMDRFMDDTKTRSYHTMGRERGDGADSDSDTSPPRFRNLEEKCRFYWNNVSDTDMESSYERDAVQLDMAFMLEPEPEIGAPDAEVKTEIDALKSAPSHVQEYFLNDSYFNGGVKDNRENVQISELVKTDKRLVNYSFSDSDNDSSFVSAGNASNTLDSEIGDAKIGQSRKLKYCEAKSDSGLSSIGVDDLSDLSETIV